MDSETNTSIADGIAAEIADIDENVPGYSATGRAFLVGAERAFRGISERAHEHDYVIGSDEGDRAQPLELFLHECRDCGDKRWAPTHHPDGRPMWPVIESWPAA